MFSGDAFRAASAVCPFRRACDASVAGCDVGGYRICARRVLAACSSAARPAGTDGDLLDDWQAMPAPSPIVPVAGRCYYDDRRDMMSAKVVDCTEWHQAEVTHVGTLTGPMANDSAPPPPASADLSVAYAKCAAPTRAYLGGDWHAALLDLTVTVPDTRNPASSSAASRASATGPLRADVTKRLLPVAIAAWVIALVITALWWSHRGTPIPTSAPRTAPAVGSCWAVDDATISATLPWPGQPVACTVTHTAEVAYVGQADHTLIDAAQRRRVSRNRSPRS